MYGDEPVRLFDNVMLFRATRQPCPVCGQSTGDCTGASAPPTHISGMGGVYESQKEIATMLVEKDIFEERQINPYFRTRVLLHPKGSYVTVEQAKNLGLL